MRTNMVISLNVDHIEETVTILVATRIGSRQLTMPESGPLYEQLQEWLLRFYRATDEEEVMKAAHQRREYADSEAFTQLSEVDQLTYEILSNWLLQAVEDQVNDLDKFISADLGDAPVQEKLATVIQLFDGNRRASRTRELR
jgi:hypothetical protein